MTPTEQKQLVQRLAALAELKRATLSPPALKLWVEMVDDLPYAAVVAALHSLAKTSPFLPDVAEVRKHLQPPIDQAQQAKLAWDEMVREVKRVGSWGSPELAPATRACVQAVWGSWQNLCATLPAGGPELVGWQKQWDAHYSAHAVAAERREALVDSEALHRLRVVLTARGLPAGEGV